MNMKKWNFDYIMKKFFYTYILFIAPLYEGWFAVSVLHVKVASKYAPCVDIIVSAVDLCSIDDPKTQ